MPSRWARCTTAAKSERRSEQKRRVLSESGHGATEKYQGATSSAVGPSGRAVEPKDEPDVQLNLKVRGLGPSATVAINERSNALCRQGRKIFKLGLGQSPFPVPDSVAQSLRDNAHQKDYLPTQGLQELRQAVADHHRRNFGIHCSADDVLIGPGSKELMFLLQLVYYGDLVLPTPTWVSYAPQAKILHRDVTLLKTDSKRPWRLPPDQLDELCRDDPDHPRIAWCSTTLRTPPAPPTTARS